MRIWGVVLAAVVTILSARVGAVECAPPLEADGTLASMPDRLAEPKGVVEIYHRLGNRCLWSKEDADEAVAVLGGVADDGLDPSDFHQSRVRALADAATAGGRREHDILLTDGALHYARIMARGRLDLDDVDRDTEFPPKPVSFVDDFAAALSPGRAGVYLSGLMPRAPEYGRLKAALVRYRDLTAKGGWQPLPEGPSLRPGASGAAIAALEARLKAEGDLTDPGSAGVYDGALVAAVKRFQSRHGLTPDGIVGARTRAALNVTAADRVRQITVDLARWRMLDYAVPATRFEVNVPAAAARLVVDDKTVLDMRAVVGDPRHPTPMLASTITAIALNPSWTVPSSIVKAEIQPILKRDPGYLERNNMRWIDGNLVQAPGGTNPLGRVRFTFSNRFGVFLHDTSAPSLFASDQRARSHGCIRLEKPIDLAAILLENDPEWPRDQIEQTIATGRTVRIPLAKTIPVVVAYWTAFVDPDGTIEFRDDIYGRDQRLAAALRTLDDGYSDGGSGDGDGPMAQACGPT